MSDSLPALKLIVALRKESVDRNAHEMSSQEVFWPSLSARRAWIEINVIYLSFFHRTVSLSARRAWIEIGVMRQNPGKHYVALRKESVDRNWSAYPKKTGKAESLSARRAWIEIKA